MKNKITIVIPCYNVEKYLPDCLESILAQTHENWECLCMNDGSKDDTWRVLQDYARRDNRIKVFTQTNAGVTRTRNVLLDKIADTDYLYFTDSDDYLHPQMFEIFLHFIKQFDADVVECRNKPVFDEPRETHINPIGFDEIHPRLLTDMDIFFDKKKRIGGWFQIWNKLYRWDKVRDIRFSEQLVNEDDFFYCSQVHAQIDNKVILDIALYFYRKNPNSLTRSLNFERYAMSGINRIWLSYEYFVKGGRVPAIYLDAFRRDLAKDAYRMCIRKSLKKCPDARLRKKLFLSASDAMNQYVAAGAVDTRYLSPLQQIVFWCVRKKWYLPARVLVFVA